MGVEIVEVGPRDGLQNESQMIDVPTRVELIRRLRTAGLRTIETGAFVRADRVPQMAGSDEVFRATDSFDIDERICLVPNVKGLERAREVGLQNAAVFVAVSETFNQRNSNCSVADGLAMSREVIERATADAMLVRGYVSTVAGCPYEGATAVADVVRVARELYRFGCYEISLGDTIGVGTPRQIAALVRAVAGEVPIEALAFHGHDTYGMGIANAISAIECGVRRIDASVGGLGGCPFGGPNAKGNLATEDLVYALGAEGLLAPIDLALLVETSWWLSSFTGHDPRASVAHALRNKSL
jgi:hydroxymethylglutaryl-CoA lyase